MPWESIEEDFSKEPVWLPWGRAGLSRISGLPKRPRRANHRGIAMTIGLNRVDSNTYPGAPPLRGCVNDAKDIYDIARLQGFE